MCNMAVLQPSPQGSILLLADGNPICLDPLHHYPFIIVICILVLTPSTLDSCSYRFKMYLKAENMPFHMVKTVFKYSF